MDGVLVDTPELMTQAYNTVLKEYGVQLSVEDRKKTSGMPLVDQLHRWQADLHTKEPIDAEDFIKRSTAIKKELFKSLKPNNTLIKFLENARENGILLAVGTSNTRDNAEHLLTLVKIRKYMYAIVTEEDTQKPKPDPDVFLKAAEKLNVDPKKCVVFEDATKGLEAATRAKMKTVALLTKYGSKEDFEGRANIIISNFSEISLQKIDNLFDTRQIPDKKIRRQC